MKKFILILFASISLMFLIIKIAFISCSASTEVKAISSNEIETTLSDGFLGFEIIVRDNANGLKIIMDKNTEVFYIISYHYGSISPMYSDDGTIMTKEKWLAKHTKKE